jgi:phosphoribosyl 1,2-cyclic phosphodiesterase
MMRFCVLASGSSGNASLLTDGRFGALLDLGLGPRTLARRLADVGASWDDINAAFLTHVHSDHWNENTLVHLRRRNIPLHCHPSHARALKVASPGFADLLENDRLCFYDVDRQMTLAEGITCRPLPLKHDGGITCGFRFEGTVDRCGQTWALAYAADLGSWDTDLADGLANVDVLALEFNHDETMEKQSGRAQSLIRRVLGAHGHLSNKQAAELLTEVLARSDCGRLQHVVQLHLSRQCNRPDLARNAVRKVLRDKSRTVTLHTAAQDCPGPWLAPGRSRPERKERMQPACTNQQPWLPGWEP